MKKIVSLLNDAAMKRIFTRESLDELAKIGEFTQIDYEGKLSDEKTKELVKDANIIITSWGSPRLTGDIISVAPDLELVVHAAGSIKSVVSEELWDANVRVTGSAAVLGKGVAETTLGLAITSMKYVYPLNETIKNGQWSEEKHKVREFYNCTVGVVSAGFVGRHFIKLLQNFDVDVLLYDPYVTQEEAKAMGAEKVELNDLLKRSDVVSLHAPSIPATDRMLNKETMKLMKDNAVLINTARGSLIDEADLAEELKKGRFFACIDVTNPEPPAVDHPFRGLPNVIMTPHIAGLVTTGLIRIGRFAVEEIEKYLNNEPMVGEVKREKLTTMA